MQREPGPAVAVIPGSAVAVEDRLQHRQCKRSGISTEHRTGPRILRIVVSANIGVASSPGSVGQLKRKCAADAIRQASADPGAVVELDAGVT